MKSSNKNKLGASFTALLAFGLIRFIAYLYTNAIISENQTRIIYENGNPTGIATNETLRQFWQDPEIYANIGIAGIAISLGLMILFFVKIKTDERILQK